MDVSARAIARAERDVLAEFSRRDPALLGSYRDHVRRATRIVGDRVARAATVEHVALDDLSDAAQRQLGNCVANYALAMLGAQQRAHRLRGQAGAGHTMLSWARAQRRADPDRSLLAFFEQWVIDGHPLHPATKVREPMTAADVLDTSPERATSFRSRSRLRSDDRRRARRTGRQHAVERRRAHPTAARRASRAGPRTRRRRVACRVEHPDPAAPVAGAQRRRRTLRSAAAQRGTTTAEAHDPGATAGVLPDTRPAGDAPRPTPPPPQDLSERAADARRAPGTRRPRPTTRRRCRLC